MRSAANSGPCWPATPTVRRCPPSCRCGSRASSRASRVAAESPVALGPPGGSAVRSHAVSRLARISFRVWLALIALGGLALRIVYVLMSKADGPPEGDAVYFYGQARTVADGHGFLD